MLKVLWLQKLNRDQIQQFQDNFMKKNKFTPAEHHFLDVGGFVVTKTQGLANLEENFQTSQFVIADASTDLFRDALLYSTMVKLLKK